jgi:photosystem II stability/assembly factor-like uncharacterized protein
MSMATVLYLGTDEGVATVRGDGSSWELQHRALSNWDVCEVSATPAAPNVVFAGTRGDGVWRSEDSGKSWKKPSYGKRGPGKVRCVTMDPRDERTLYAGAEPIDVFVSHDAGASWECLDSLRDEPFVGTIQYPVAVVEPHVRDIAVDPTDSRIMYVALQVGYMMKTTDGGATWKLLDKQLDADVHTIGLSASDPSHVLIATGGHDYRLGKAPGKALYRSADGGETWQPSGASLDQEYSVPLVIDPTNPRVAFAGLAHGTPGAWRRPSGAEATIARTTDGGDSWQEVGRDLPDAGQRMAIGIAVDPVEPSNVYVALSDGQLLASHDGGDSWSRLEVRTPPPNDIKCVRD